jgi:hypothetical protein
MNSDTSPCLYAHEVAALMAAIAALDKTAGYSQKPQRKPSYKSLKKSEKPNEINAIIDEVL